VFVESASSVAEAEVTLTRHGEMRWTGGNRIAKRVLIGGPEGKRPADNLNVSGRIILK
jgi:hypothetical protein